MTEYLFSDKQITANWQTFREIIDEISPSRKLALNKMYDDLEGRAKIAPASSYNYFHNAIPGGYVDHVLRVYFNAIKHYELWKDSGLIVDNFTLEELSFAALHHDLWKLGMPGKGNELYLPNKTKPWHKENQGLVYLTNPDLGFMESNQRTLYLLNYYGIPYTENELIGIQLTDGMYAESNKPYLVSFDLNKKVRTSLGSILHHADFMATRYEFEQWAIATNSFKFNREDDRKPSVNSNDNQPTKSNAALSTFDKLFPELNT